MTVVLGALRHPDLELRLLYDDGQVGAGLDGVFQRPLLGLGKRLEQVAAGHHQATHDDERDEEKVGGVWQQERRRDTPDPRACVQVSDTQVPDDGRVELSAEHGHHHPHAKDVHPGEHGQHGDDGAPG